MRTRFAPTGCSCGKCLVCKREISRERAKRHYWKDPARSRARSRSWRDANLDKAKAIGAKANAKRLRERWAENLNYSAHAKTKTARFGPSDLDADYIRSLFEQQGGRCYWLGVPMVPSGAKRDPRRPSLDRLDNSRGYVRGNVVLACMFANMGRSQLDAGEFRAFVRELMQQVG